MWSKVFEEQAHRSCVTKRQERNDLQKSFTNSRVRLDKRTLDVLEEDLQLVSSFSLV